MKHTIKEKVIDNYKEHELHEKYDKNCSSCWTENLVMKQWARKERERNGIGRNHFTDNQISPNPIRD